MADRSTHRRVQRMQAARVGRRPRRDDLLCPARLLAAAGRGCWPAAPDDLSLREGEILALVANGLSNCLAPDLRDCLDTAAVSKRLEQVAVPLLLLRAPGGLTGTGDAVVPDQLRDSITALAAKTTVTDVPGTNHHTILFSTPGARAVAQAITAFTGQHHPGRLAAVSRRRRERGTCGNSAS